MLEPGVNPGLCRNCEFLKSYLKGKSDTATIKPMFPSRNRSDNCPPLPARTKNERVFFMSLNGVATLERSPDKLASFVDPFDALSPYLGQTTPFIQPPYEHSDYRPFEVNPAAFVAFEGAITPAAETVKEESVHRVGSLAVEQFVRLDSLPGNERTDQRYDTFLRSVAMHNSVSQRPNAPKPHYRSVLDLLRDAGNGDQESFDALVLEDETHAREVMGGVGESITVKLKVDNKGDVVWGRQNTEDRQFYTLTTYTFSREMLRAEHAAGRTGFRLEDRNREGQLSGKMVFEFSAVPSATRQELAERGYFLNSIACCIRGTRFTDSECEINSKFAAGVDQRGLMPKVGESEVEEALRQEEALAKRFDIIVLRRMLTLLGVKGAEAMEPDELLASAVVGPEGFDTVDMMMLYDSVATELMANNEKTFLGSVQLWERMGSPKVLIREHYDRYFAQQEVQNKARKQLYKEMAAEQIRRRHEATTPTEAMELKRRVVLEMSVEQAARDETIDASRFGRISSERIILAREAYAAGDIEGGDNHVKEAKKTATDPSCPGGDKKMEAPDGDRKKYGDDEECTEVENGAKVKCPYCKKSVRAVVPKKGGEIFCSNPRCTAAAPHLKRAGRRERVSEIKKERKKRTPLLKPEEKDDERQ